MARGWQPVIGRVPSLWESATGSVLGTLAEHKDAITSLSWRGDGQLLVSASEEDGQIIIWNVTDGFRWHHLQGAPA